MSVTIRTNNKPRETVLGYELTKKQKAAFDYINADSIDSHEFIKYKGRVYDLGDFVRLPNEDSPFSGWVAISPDSFFSGVLIRFVNDCEQVIIASYTC